jgi:hypothetical protein
MSGDKDISREAPTPDEGKTLNSFWKLGKDNFPNFLSDSNKLNAVKSASEEIRKKFDEKCAKMGVENPLATSPPVGAFQPGSMSENKAPAIIKERDKSSPPKIPESQDIEYLSHQEVVLEDEINTLRERLVEAPELGDTANRFIERCMGRNPESHKLMVVRIPARAVPILPGQVMRYLGNVVMDLNSVHTGNIVFQRRRFGYVFDRFFHHNNKKLVRCCMVDDRVHQAGLMYEKFVHRKSQKAMARIRRLPGQGDAPMYEVIGAKETDYRDLKRLYERHFLNRSDRIEVDDPAFTKLIEGAMPLIPTE